MQEINLITNVEVVMKKRKVSDKYSDMWIFYYKWKVRKLGAMRWESTKKG